MSRYTVEFHGALPGDLRVGDKLKIEGQVTVRSITAALVDITSLGSEPEFTLGEVTIDLISNRLEVTK